MTNPGDDIDDEYLDPFKESAVIHDLTKLFFTPVLRGKFAKTFTGRSHWLYTSLLQYSLVGPLWSFTLAMH